MDFSNDSIGKMVQIEMSNLQDILGAKRIYDTTQYNRVFEAFYDLIKEREKIRSCLIHNEVSLNLGRESAAAHIVNYINEINEMMPVPQSITDKAKSIIHIAIEENKKLNQRLINI